MPAGSGKGRAFLRFSYATSVCRETRNQYDVSSERGRGLTTPNWGLLRSTRAIPPLYNARGPSSATVQTTPSANYPRFSSTQSNSRILRSPSKTPL